MTAGALAGDVRFLDLSRVVVVILPGCFAVGALLGQGIAELPLGFAGDDGNLPRLAVDSRWRPTGALQNSGDDFIRHWFVQKCPSGLAVSNCLCDFHWLFQLLAT